MKPTQEQLNDPKWWDLNSAGRDYVFYNSRLKRVEFASKDGRDCKYGGCLVFSAGGWRLLAKRPTKPAFVPNTETKTIYWVAEVDSYGTPWNFDGPHDDYKSAEDSIPLLLAVGNKNRKLVVTSMEFRPIKSERELFIKQLAKLGKGYGSLYSEEFAGEVYDSGLFCLKEPVK